MSWRCLLVMYLLFFVFCQKCNSHSISVVVNHRHTFAVREIREPSHIELPKEVEVELKFDPNTPENGGADVSPRNTGMEDRKDYESRAAKDYDHEEIRDMNEMNSETRDTDVDEYGYPEIFDDNEDDENNQYDDVEDVDNEDDELTFYDDFDENEGNESLNTKTDIGNIDNVDVVNDDTGNDNDFDDFEVSNKHPTNTIKEPPSLHHQPYNNGKDFPNDQVSDIIHEEEEIDKLYKLAKRNKRAAREQWRNSLRGIDESRSKEDPLTSDIWEDVTDEELNSIQKREYIRLAKYAGWTLLTVIFFVLVGICFLRDPMACIFSFGTGCPCFFILIPCIRGFIEKHLNVKQMVKDAMNKYTPGVIVHDDGSLQHYEPTAEEVGYLKELLDELAGGAVV